MFLRKICIFTGIFFLLFTAVNLSGCNTVKGFGQDMQAGGRALSTAAQR